MKLTVPISVVVSTVLSTGTLSAQPAFEVASIKPSIAGREMFRADDIHASPGSLMMNNVTVASCLKWAYKVQDPQIAGPDWIRNDTFSIAAKAGEQAADDQLRAMLQTLLADRFKVQLHRESKTMSGFALVAGKNGPKLASSLSEGAPEIRGRMKWIATRYSMADVADFLAANTTSLVADMTGIQGRFDFTLDLGPYLSIDTPILKNEAAQVLSAAFQSAIEAQLGLKLEARKVPVEVLVIDHVERPSEN
jgi:uncharacterized protein (TIGR03435 family)